MTLRATLAEIASITGGVLTGDPAIEVRGVSTDSRSVSSRALFVAIAGERFDGHDHTGEALAAGAAAALTSRPDVRSEPRVEVTDTLDALALLAAHHRRFLRARVVAVTGSTGKTTTKDLLAAALPGAHASQRSFNNEVGVPLTVLSTPDDAPFGVYEVGSRGRGHIASLMPVVRPDVAVITNLGTVHLETFGTTDDLAAAKFELVEALTERGTAVLPAGERRLLDRSHAGSTVTFGVDTEATVTAHDVVVDELGIPTFGVTTPSGDATVTLSMPGAFQAANAAAAIAAGLALDVPLTTLVAGLERARGSAWRMEMHRGRFLVVNDAYNANPQSVEAALRTVAALPGRHVAVLGRMAELGSVSVAEHDRIGALVRSLGFARCFVVGDAEGLADAAGDIATRVDDADTAYEAVVEEVSDGDVVLVKASRSVGLEKLAHRLAVAAEEAPS